MINVRFTLNTSPLNDLFHKQLIQKIHNLAIEIKKRLALIFHAHINLKQVKRTEKPRFCMHKTRQTKV